MSYRERLLPSPWHFLAGLLLVPAVLLVFAPISVPLGIILGAALYAGYAGFLVAASPIVSVDEREIRVGGATLPIAFAGEATAYSTRAAARRAAGPELDARAWLCLRGWVATSVRLEVADPADPVPYWLFSTRDPERVAAAIAEARAAKSLERGAAARR